MNLHDVFNEKLINLSLAPTDKATCIKSLAKLLKEQGVINDLDKYVSDVLNREADFSTDLDVGVAIPHAKSSAVLKPAIAVGLLSEGMVFGDNPDNITKIIFLIAMPESANSEHITLLASITEKFLDDQLLQKLFNASSKKQFLADLLEEKKSDNISPKSNNGSQKLVLGVTGCPVGVAHTYLAAKALKKAGDELGVEVKVETNGSIGIENALTDDDINRAVGIVVASDKDVEINRFDGKKVIFTGVKDGVDKPKKLIEDVLSDNTPIFKANDSIKIDNSNSKQKSAFYKSLMNGVSYMIPFVVIGGLLIAISLALGGEPTSGGLAIPEGSHWNNVLNIGSVGFTLMIPILSGYIAFAIGDRPALAPGLIGGWIANTGSFYGADAGTGFIGAIVAGFLVGYFVKFIKSLKVHKNIEPLMPIMIIPIISSLFIGFTFIYVIGSPISSLMESLFSMLENMSSGNVILLGLVLGLMQGFDMGGPFGKVAFLFCVGLVTEGQYQFMGALAMSIPVAPLGMALATFIGKKFNLYSDDDIVNGQAAFSMGLVGISEGAIPFAAADPSCVIPANMIGSAVACIMAFLFGITNTVAHGGPIVLILGVVNKPLLGLLCMITGSVITAVITIALKKAKLNKEKLVSA